MKLYGSKTSPFVRKVRIALEEIPYEFVSVDLFNPTDRKSFAKITPIMKIPVLKDDDTNIYDSDNILRYLNNKYWKRPYCLKAENHQILIHEANLTSIELFLMERSGISIEDNNLYLETRKSRVRDILAFLEDNHSDFHNWGNKEIALYCFLDWALFRNRLDLADYSNLTGFYRSNQNHPIVKATDPRI